LRVDGFLVDGVLIAATFAAGKGRKRVLLEKTSREVSLAKKQPERPSVHKYQKMSKRLPYLLQMLETSPADSFVLFAIAKEYESTGDADKAFEFYEKLRATDPSYVGLYYHLGKLFEQKQDFENAVSTYKQGIETARKASDFHSLSELQGALLNLEDPDE
jgi:tetratricopeptide (TPR) repeat protein